MSRTVMVRNGPELNLREHSTQLTPLGTQEAAVPHITGATSRRPMPPSPGGQPNSQVKGATRGHTGGVLLRAGLCRDGPEVWALLSTTARSSHGLRAAHSKVRSTRVAGQALRRPRQHVLRRSGLPTDPPPTRLPGNKHRDTTGRAGRVGLLPGYVADKLLVVHHDAQLAGPGREHVQWLWKQGKLLSGGCSQDDGPPPGLGHAILTSLWKGSDTHSQAPS